MATRITEAQSQVSAESVRQRNPHFDDNRIIWDDAYSGEYAPVEYSEQFDDQWRLFIEKRIGFHNHTGVETSDEYIDDRIEELTGVKDYLLKKKAGALAPLIKVVSGRERRAQRRGVGGRLILDPKFPINFFEGKECLDLGCGAGRWTKTLKSLGGKVLATDVSEHGLKSAARYADQVEVLNLFDIIEKRSDLHSRFDFTICWGVIMCTHDPKLAFENVARTVKPGGSLYVMVYAPTYHASEEVVLARKHYHTKLRTMEERLAYVYECADAPENAINLLDMLNTFYNWTIREETVRNWYAENGYTDVRWLNEAEPHFCGYHFLARKT